MSDTIGLPPSAATATMSFIAEMCVASCLLVRNTTASECATVASAASVPIRYIVVRFADV